MKDPDRLATFAADTAWVGTRVLVPTSFLLLVFGMLDRGLQANFDFGALWITLGLVVFLISFRGRGGLSRARERSHRQSSLPPAVLADPRSSMRIAGFFLISRIELVLLLPGSVVDMVVKPK